MGDYSDIVSSVISEVPFEKVGDLSKEQFADILAKVINEVFSSREYIEDMYREIAKTNTDKKIRSNGRDGF